MSRSKEKHFAVDVWSLCVPCSLSPDETRWWEKWKKSQKEKGYSLRIELIDETVLRADLDTPDAEHIKMGYFGPSPTIAHYFLQALQGRPEREIQTLPELSLYQESLFIRKLVAAGINEVRSAKTQFFNAELLTQEISDKGDPREITSVHSLQEKLRSVWETRFNEACAEPQNKFGNLYPGTMRAIEEQDATSLGARTSKRPLFTSKALCISSRITVRLDGRRTSEASLRKESSRATMTEDQSRPIRFSAEDENLFNSARLLILFQILDETEYSSGANVEDCIL